MSVTIGINTVAPYVSKEVAYTPLAQADKAIDDAALSLPEAYRLLLAKKSKDLVRLAAKNMDHVETHHRLMTGTVPRSLQIGFTLTGSAKIKETEEFEALKKETEQAKTDYVTAQLKIIAKAQKLESAAQVREIEKCFITLVHNLVNGLFLHNMIDYTPKTLLGTVKSLMFNVLPTLFQPQINADTLIMTFEKLFVTSDTAATTASSESSDSEMDDDDTADKEDNTNPFIPVGVKLRPASKNNLGVVESLAGKYLKYLAQRPLLLLSFVRTDIHNAKVMNKNIAMRETEEKTSEVDEIIKAGAATDHETIKKLVATLVAKEIGKKKPPTKGKTGKQTSKKNEKKLKDSHPKEKAGDSSRHGQNLKKSPSKKGKGKVAGSPKGAAKGPKTVLKKPPIGKKRNNFDAKGNSNKKSRKN